MSLAVQPSPQSGSASELLTPPLSRFWWAVGLLGGLGFLVGLLIVNELLMQLSRVLPHLALLAFAWQQTKPSDINAQLAKATLPPRFWLILGLATCMAADFVIRRPQGFISGIYGFLLAQLAFITAFSRMKPEWRWAVALPFVGYAAALVTFLWPSLGDFQGPVVVYAAVIALMGWRAWVTETRSLQAGALLFMLSDSLLAIEKFGAPAEGEYHFLRIPIILTYWAALALLMKRTS